MKQKKVAGSGMDKAYVGPPGVYPVFFWVGVYRGDSETFTLYQTMFS